MNARRFDVFLSHNSVDKLWAMRLKDALQARGLSVWLDRDEIRPGDIFVTALQRGIEQSKSVALVVSPEALASGWVEEEYARAIALTPGKGQSNMQLIPVILRDSVLPGFLANRHWVDFRGASGDELPAHALERLIWGITGDKPPDPMARPIKTSALLDRRLVIELMMLLSETASREPRERMANTLVAASYAYEQLFFENAYGSSLHALQKQLNEAQRGIVLALPSLVEHEDDLVDVGEDAKASWLRDPQFRLALSRYDQTKGGASNPQDIVEYLDRSIRLARRFDLALLPHPDRFPLYLWIFTNCSQATATLFSHAAAMSSTQAPGHAVLDLPQGRVVDHADGGDLVPLPAPATLHRFGPLSYPIPPDVLPRYDAAFLAQLRTCQYECVAFP